MIGVRLDEASGFEQNSVVDRVLVLNYLSGNPFGGVAVVDLSVDKVFGIEVPLHCTVSSVELIILLLVDPGWKWRAWLQQVQCCSHRSA